MSQWIRSGWYFNYISLKTLHVHSTFGCCTLTFNKYVTWLCVWSEGSTLMMDVTAALFFMKVSTDVEHILICTVFKGGFCRKNSMKTPKKISTLSVQSDDIWLLLWCEGQELFHTDKRLNHRRPHCESSSCRECSGNSRLICCRGVTRFTVQL